MGRSRRSFSTPLRLKDASGERQFVNTDDLPVPAYDTTDTTVSVFGAEEHDHVRVAAIISDAGDCDPIRIRRAALDEFEPPELVVVQADGTPFRITGVQLAKTAGGTLSRVDHTVEVDASQTATASAQLAVVVFEYSDRGEVFRAKMAHRHRGLAPNHAASGSVYLGGLHVPRGATWKLAVMVSSGTFTKENGATEPWSLGTSAEENAIALPALYSARR